MITIGDKIRINDELCPLEKRTDKEFQFGKLGYFSIMLDWEFEVVNQFDHSYNGSMITCKVLNRDDVECDVVLRTKDVVRMGASKFKINFEVIGTTRKNQAVIDDLTTKEQTLLTSRKFSKLQGLKISELKDNWSEILKVRTLMKKELEKTESSTVFKTNQGVFTLDIDPTDENKVTNALRQEIRRKRASSKITNTKVKQIAGNMNYKTIGGVLEKAGTFLALNEKFAINVINEYKKPISVENYVGIEIEMLTSISIEEMNKEFIKARLHRFVNIANDSSIRTDQDGSKAMELRILLPESQLETKLKEICAVLRTNDCYSNRSCGMHVHLDMRNRDAELAYKNLFKLQEIMLSSQPKARRANTYCKPNTKATMKLAEFKNEDRYKVINTASYDKKVGDNELRTLEIRVHEGVTKFKDIYNWTKFLVDTVNQTKVFKKAVKTIDDLESLGYIDSKVLAHLDERIQEYAS